MDVDDSLPYVNKVLCDVNEKVTNMAMFQTASLKHPPHPGMQVAAESQDNSVILLLVFVCWPCF